MNNRTNPTDVRLALGSPQSMYASGLGLSCTLPSKLTSLACSFVSALGTVGRQSVYRKGCPYIHMELGCGIMLIGFGKGAVCYQSICGGAAHPVDIKPVHSLQHRDNPAVKSSFRNIKPKNSTGVFTREDNQSCWGSIVEVYVYGLQVWKGHIKSTLWLHTAVWQMNCAASLWMSYCCHTVSYQSRHFISDIWWKLQWCCSAVDLSFTSGSAPLCILSTATSIPCWCCRVTVSTLQPAQHELQISTISSPGSRHNPDSFPNLLLTFTRRGGDSGGAWEEAFSVCRL